MSPDAPDGNPATVSVNDPACEVYATAAACATSEAETFTVRVAGEGAYVVPLTVTDEAEIV